MVRNELIKRSPLRILERSTHGGLGKGNIGVVAAPKGVGKTACLVHIATDQLLEGRHVIHVSFAAETGHIIAWYEDIFREIARRYALDSAMEIHDDIIKNRVIMNFKQNGVSVQQVRRSVYSMIRDGQFHADVVVIDGYDFMKATVDDVGVFKEFAQEAGLEIWFSAAVRDNSTKRTIDNFPEELHAFIRFISVFIELEPCGKYIQLKLVKDHDNTGVADPHLKLDPQILLIAENSEIGSGFTF
ncbi:MAG: hypothetical protein JW768_09460 [Chitinispirillaceae bacterium]|nr:hypothetical protein [Chitinispirillaceae bacterium]